MKNSNEKSNGALQSAQVIHPGTVSERKLKANRENAKKSTGPKTLVGKAYSRMNSVKHGLFFRNFDDRLEAEDPEEFEAFYLNLRAELQPVGPTEENLVQFIAITWRKRQRLERYENAVIESDMNRVAEKEDDKQYLRLTGSDRMRNLCLILKTAEREIEASGEISPESRETISADWELQFSWSRYEAAAKKTAKNASQELAIAIAESRQIPVSEAKQLLSRNPSSLPEYVRFVKLETVREAFREYADRRMESLQRVIKIEYQKCLVPSASEVDKLVRYGNAIEKELGRAYQMLFSMQQMRLGKSPASLRSEPAVRTPRERLAPSNGAEKFLPAKEPTPQLDPSEPQDPALQ